MDKSIEVRRYTGLTRMPKKMSANDKRIWIRAIAELAKKDGEVSYGVVMNDYGRKPRIVKVFGSSSAIAEIRELRPFSWLREDMVPAFVSENDRLAYIAKTYGTSLEKVKSLPAEEVQRLYYTILINAQIEYERVNGSI